MTTDHVELLVPDREKAAAWYSEWLKFVRMAEHADWAKSGPIMLTCDRGQTMLALFTGEPQGVAGRPQGWRRLALRADAAEFVAFFRRYRASGQPITDPTDHQKAWSVYFSDPWGNPLEVTSYDYAAVPRMLKG